MASKEFHDLSGPDLVPCPICSRSVRASDINAHIDSGCQDAEPPSTQSKLTAKKSASNLASIFRPKPSGHAATDNQTLPSPSPSLPKGKKRASNDTVSAGSIQTKRTKITTQLQSIAPLAERMRPERLEEFIGHAHLTDPNSMFMNGVANRSLGSMIFWGPPGCGKTTLARLYAKQTDSVFKELSATVVGINDIRAVFEEAKNTFLLTRRRTILFLDEIHRFNRSQQDIFLPFVEQGHIQLLGATTENPSFKLTGALLSRCRVFVLERLTDGDIQAIVKNALFKLSRSSDTRALDVIDVSSSQSESSSQGSSSTSASLASFPQFTDKVLASIVSLASGDARTALSMVELVSKSNLPEETLIVDLRRSVSTSYDRTGDSHYDLISALHKSVRGSQGSAAMYWLARMLTGGEDPLFIARRMVVCASEDIGMADPQALPLAMAALQACQTIGMPECRINLAHIVAYLSEAPKCTRAYEAYKRAEEAAKADLTLPVPLAVRNAPTKLLSELGCGADYHYNPDYAHPVTNTYLPPKLENAVFLRRAGDKSGKIWDEEALKQWEVKENNGGKWVGRLADSCTGKS